MGASALDAFYSPEETPLLLLSRVPARQASTNNLGSLAHLSFNASQVF